MSSAGPSEALWQRVRDELERSVEPSAFGTWLAALHPVAVDADTLVLAAPDSHRRWVQDRYARALRAAAAVVLGPRATVRVVGENEVAGEVLTAAAGAGEPEPGRPELNPRLTFESFVIGDANRLAHAAALAVAELPGSAYNPLFLYGPPGTGKTHLLQAIANYAVTCGPGLRVRYTTAERFTSEFTAAVAMRDTREFKGRYRANDLLLIDDVQFLQRKTATEEEFFHTFNALHDSGAQLVLGCDRMPRDLEALADRLRERFASGLVCDLAPPDRATRLTLLRRHAHQDGVVPAEDGVLELIAERIAADVRALEGALVRVVAYASMHRSPLTVALTERVLDGLYGRPTGRTGALPGTAAARPTVEEVQAAVCEAFGLEREELLSAKRSGRLTWPRQLAMYLAREHTGASLPAIGEAFGGRGHTTVLHALRRIEERLAVDSEVRDTLDALARRLRADRGS